ncbi:MAG: hypothetical protein IPK82_19415 [Polyangiaceae bacterium]|nr:hypothetical protein [Polyangiaceae bacterium]
MTTQSTRHRILSSSGVGPDFVMAGGSGGMLQLTPPFDFQGVTMRVFPLRASLPRLTKFVDSYLNIIPREVGYFRPFLPYVYLMIINYGKMAVEAANMGWIAQNEIAFSIALEWYKEVDDKLIFHDFAYVSPFIYVDNDLSMTTGREVYGWPKSLVSITPETTSWMEDPRKAPRLVTVSAMVFPELYTGACQEMRPLLEVTQKAAPSLTQMLPDMQNPLFPWVSIPNAIRSSAALTADFWRVMNGLGITRQPKASATGRAPAAIIPEAASLTNLVKTVGNLLNPYSPNLFFNTINLKQFRDSQVPGAFCYQAVTNAKMSLVKMNGFGMLGDLQMALGDASGGFTIAMHQWPTHPITDALGIEVTRQYAGDGANVVELTPVCPMWMDVDMRYGKGVALAFRARGQEWHEVVVDGAAPQVAQEIDLPEFESLTALKMDELYNTSLGTSLDLTGPFDFPSTTMRVLPLLADPEKLQALCDGLLNGPLESAKQVFKPWGRYVYLEATSYEEMASLSNNIGSWADNDVVFYVPVQWYERDGAEEVFKTVALLPLFAFADGTTVAITRSEVTGIPTQKAQIESPPDTWMEDSGPSNNTARRLLSVTAQVLPVLGMGQPTSERKLIEISEHDDAVPYNDDVRWRFIAENWGTNALGELDRKCRARSEQSNEVTDLKALAAGLLTGQIPFRILTLKQFRSAGEPSKACYQSLTEVDRIIERVFDVREIDSRMLVRIHRYESRPIAQALGLIPKWTEYSGATQVDVFQAVRPFWMKVAMREQLGIRHFWRSAGHAEWQVDSANRHSGCVFSEEAPRPDVGRTLVERIENGVPQRLFDHVRAWAAAGAPDRIKADDAVRAALSAEPQVAIESILSNEWEHWGDPLWFRASQEFRRRLQEAMLGSTAAGTTANELKVANEVLAVIEDLFDVGRPDVLEQVRGMLNSGQLFHDHMQVVVECADEIGHLQKSAFATEAEYFEKCTPILLKAGEHIQALKSFLTDMQLDFDPQRVASTRENPLAPVVAILEARWKKGAEEILRRFSKVVQKPEVFMRRDTLGTETDRRMPIRHAYGPGRLWYVGRNPNGFGSDKVG